MELIGKCFPKSVRWIVLKAAMDAQFARLRLAFAEVP
jgi:hypothetical protein